MDKKASFDYINNYQKKNYDRITILRKSGDKQKLTDISNSLGYRTLTEFINQAINDKLESLENN